MLDPTAAEKLREKLQSCDNLPSLSAVALEVLNLIRQDNASLKQLAEVISQDPALATKVLRTVNSSFYGLAKKIKTIHHATIVLGMSAVKSLALSFSLVKTVSGAESSQFNFRQFWAGSLTRGVAAKKLAVSIAPDLLDEAFIASLLSHVGMLAINTIAADEYEKVLSALKIEGGTVAEWEMKILGFTHSDCGAELGNIWRLPDEYITAIQHHDETGEFLYGDSRTAQLVNIVRGASLISRCFMEADKTAALKEATKFAEQTWGIDSEQLDLLLNDVKGDVETVADLFDVAIEDTCSYDQILQIANAEMAKLLMAANQPGGGQAQTDHAQFAELRKEREELEKRAERLEKLAYRDSLTGLYNMRALGEQLDNFFAQARVTSRTLGVIFFDLDGFKAINDTLGHDAANEVLCDLAAMVTGELRSTDVLCRYGGDEFAILLPDTNAQAVMTVAERLCRSVAHNVFRLPTGQTRATLSIGVSMFDGNGGYRNGEELLQDADRAMYQSKRDGKNRVSCADSVLMR